MNLLLDTHIIVWSAVDPEKLGQKVAGELESVSNELYYSPISIWEILLLSEKGRISLGRDHVRAVRDILLKIPMKEAAINAEVAMQSRTVRLPHQDPADRFLAATASVYGLTLVTADTRIIEAGAVSVLAVN